MRDFKEFLEEFYNGKIDNGLYNTTNENNEQMIITVTSDLLQTSVCQNNGWIRKNIYYKDHTTEELYEK